MPTKAAAVASCAEPSPAAGGPFCWTRQTVGGNSGASTLPNQSSGGPLSVAQQGEAFTDILSQIHTEQVRQLVALGKLATEQPTIEGGTAFVVHSIRNISQPDALYPVLSCLHGIVFSLLPESSSTSDSSLLVGCNNKSNLIALLLHLASLNLHEDAGQLIQDALSSREAWEHALSEHFTSIQTYSRAVRWDFHRCMRKAWRVWRNNITCTTKQMKSLEMTISSPETQTPSSTKSVAISKLCAPQPRCTFPNSPNVSATHNVQRVVQKHEIRETYFDGGNASIPCCNSNLPAWCASTPQHKADSSPLFQDLKVAHPPATRQADAAFEASSEPPCHKTRHLTTPKPSLLLDTPLMFQSQQHLQRQHLQCHLEEEQGMQPALRFDQLQSEHVTCTHISPRKVGHDGADPCCGPRADLITPLLQRSHDKPFPKSGHTTEDPPSRDHSEHERHAGRPTEKVKSARDRTTARVEERILPAPMSAALKPPSVQLPTRRASPRAVVCPTQSPNLASNGCGKAEPESQGTRLRGLCPPSSHLQPAVEASQPSTDWESPLSRLIPDGLSPSRVGHSGCAVPMAPLEDIPQCSAPSPEPSSTPQTAPGDARHPQLHRKPQPEPWAPPLPLQRTTAVHSSDSGTAPEMLHGAPTSASAIAFAITPSASSTSATAGEGGDATHKSRPVGLTLEASAEGDIDPGPHAAGAGAAAPTGGVETGVEQLGRTRSFSPSSIALSEITDTTADHSTQASLTGALACFDEAVAEHEAVSQGPAQWCRDPRALSLWRPAAATSAAPAPRPPSPPRSVASSSGFEGDRDERSIEFRGTVRGDGARVARAWVRWRCFVFEALQARYRAHLQSMGCLLAHRHWGRVAQGALRAWRQYTAHRVSRRRTAEASVAAARARRAQGAAFRAWRWAAAAVRCALAPARQQRLRRCFGAWRLWVRGDALQSQAVVHWRRGAQRTAFVWWRDLAVGQSARQQVLRGSLRRLWWCWRSYAHRKARERALVSRLHIRGQKALVLEYFRGWRRELQLTHARQQQHWQAVRIHQSTLQMKTFLRWWEMWLSCARERWAARRGDQAVVRRAFHRLRMATLQQSRMALEALLSSHLAATRERRRLRGAFRRWRNRHDGARLRALLADWQRRARAKRFRAWRAAARAQARAHAQLLEQWSAARDRDLLVRAWDRLQVAHRERHLAGLCRHVQSDRWQRLQRMVFCQWREEAQALGGLRQAMAQAHWMVSTLGRRLRQWRVAVARTAQRMQLARHWHRRRLLRMSFMHLQLFCLASARRRETAGACVLAMDAASVGHNGLAVLRTPEGTGGHRPVCTR